MELEDRIVLAAYGASNTISNVSILSLAEQDEVRVEIDPASFDTFTLDDGQLAGNLKLSFIDGYTPTQGDSFTVLTSLQPLTGDFAAYEGLGFFDGLYLKPVVEGNTLSLVVAEVPGGSLATTALDVVASFGGGTVSLSVVSPGVFAVTASGLNLNFPGESNSLVSVSNGGGTLVLDTNTGGLAGSLSGDVAVDFTGVALSGTVTLDFNTSDETLNDLDAHFLQLTGEGVELDISAGNIDVNLTGDFTFTRQVVEGETVVGLTIDEATLVVTAGEKELINLTASADLEISADQFVIQSATVTANQTFRLGSLFEIVNPTVGVEDFVLSSAGVSTGTFSLGAAAATLFPDKSFSAAVTDFDFTIDTLSTAFDISMGSFTLAVGDAVVVTATSSDPETTPAATFSYDPDTIDLAGTEIGLVSILTVTIPKLAGFTGTIEDLVIRNDGFAFKTATVTVEGDFNIGSVARVTDPSLTITDVDVDFADPAPFTGSITLAVAGFTLFPGNSKFTAGATDLSATFDFSDGKNGALTLSATEVTVTLNPILEFTVGDLTIDASAEGTEPVASIGSVAVNLKTVGITGRGGNFEILADGSFVAQDDFEVSLSLNTAQPNALKWPTWLPIQITSIGLQWPDINTDPNDFTIAFSASVNTASIGPGDGLPLTVQGSVDNVVIDVGKLIDGDFPIVSLDGGSLSVKGLLFGFGVDGTIIFGIVRVDADGNLINEDRLLLDEDGLPTDEESEADPEDDETLFYGGLEAGILLADKGFDLKIGLSELGPLSMFISASVPLIIEPISGLALTGFRGAVSFGDPIPEITDAKELARAEFTPPGDLTALQWQSQLKQQVANQAANGVTWEDFDNAFDHPENIRISAGATLYSAYATSSSFHADADITADLSGKFIFNAAGKFANDTLDLNFRAYLDLSEVAEGQATILFLTNVMPIQTGTTTSSSPIAVFGGVDFHYYDGNGDEITDPDESSESQHIQIVVSGGAEFKALGHFTATLTGTVTLDFDIQDTVLTLDMNGALDATYLGNIAQAAGHFTVDFDGGDGIPIVYGAMELTSGDAFDKLTELGIDADANGWFYVNTDTVDHLVTLTFLDMSTKDIDLSPLSAGLGADGTLTWQLPDAIAESSQDWFTMDGFLDVRVSASDGAEIFVNALLDVGGTLTLHAQGLLIANATGIAGMVELTRDKSRPDVFGLGIGTAFASSSTFVMVFNTTSSDQTYMLPTGITIPGQTSTITVPGGPPPSGTPGTATTWDETTKGFYFLIHAEGDLRFLSDSLIVSGEFNMLITASGIDMRMDAKVSVFGTEMKLSGQASISETNFTCDVSATASSLYAASGFEITGTFSLHVNTDAGEYWVAVTDARANLFGLVMTGGFKIGISSGGFSIEIPSSTPLSLNLFNIATFSVSGSLSTSGAFSFTASTQFNYTDTDINVGVNGSTSLSFSPSGFSGSFSGGVTVYGEPVAGVAGSLAISASQVVLSFTAYITITPSFTIDPPAVTLYYPDPSWDDPFNWSSYTYDAPSYTVDAIKAYVSFDLALGGVSPPQTPPPPPLVLARMAGSVLYLNMGVDAALRQQFTTDNSESFLISHTSGVAGNETVAVKAFGSTQSYSGVSKIVATNAGTGDDIITIESGVLSAAELHGGIGADTLSYLGSGIATLHGDDGTDILTGGGGGDVLYGGAHNDQLNGGGGSDTLHGEGGDDQLQGGGGNDSLYGGADADTLRGGDDNDRLEGGLGIDQIFGENGDDAILWLVGEGGDTRADGGPGTDTFTVTGTAAAETVSVGAAADGGSFTVDFAGTRLTGGTGIDNLVLDVQGGIDAVTINDTSSALFQHLLGITLRLGDDSAADRVVVNASTGVDTLYLSATSGVVSVDRGTGVVGGLAVRGGLATSIEQAAAHGGADTLLLNLDAGDDVAFVKSTLAGLVTTIDGGTQRTQVRVGSQADTNTGNLNSIAGTLVLGAGGGGSQDALYLFDKTDTTANTGTLTSTQITGLGMGTNGVTYSGFESLEVNLGSGGDTFNVQSSSVTTATLNTGAGGDLINVGSNAPSGNGNVAAILSSLVIDGQGGSDTLQVDDTAGGSTGTLTSSQLTGLGMAVGITYAGLETLDINLGAGDDTFNVKSTNGTTTTTIRTGDGTNTVNVASNAPTTTGHLNGIAGKLVVQGGAGSDILNLHDTSDTTANTGTLTATQINGLGMGSDGIAYAGLEALNVSLGSGGDTFTVAGTHAGTTALHGGGGDETVNVRAITGPTAIDGDDGADTIHVGSVAAAAGGTLNGIVGNLTVEGGAGLDALHADDSGDTTANAGTLTAATLTGLGLGGGITYGTIEALGVRLGSGVDTFNVVGTHAGTTALHGGGGDDALHGPDSDNTWNVTDDNSGDVTGPNPFSFVSFENLIGGDLADTFALSNGKGVSGRIDGSLGTDTLDYTAYLTAVAVDLGRGTATRVVGGITRIENVSGGAGPDILIGDDLANVLKGNGGDDLLDGQGGNDTLEGGTGHDAMFGRTGEDRMLGGDGDDVMEGNEGHDSMEGNAGEDDMIGGSSVAGTPDGDDTMDGGSGHDVLLGDNGRITRRLNAAGTEFLRYSPGATPGTGVGPENDAVIRDVVLLDLDIIGGSDSMSGGSGDDIMHGGLGDDRMFGDAGNDDMIGHLGADHMDGGAGGDALIGDHGSIVTDLLDGSTAATIDVPGIRISAKINAAGTLVRYVSMAGSTQGGDDTMIGGEGDDALHGGLGNDVLRGEGGKDALFGGAGNDRLEGGDMDDVLFGGAGDDDLDGGSGADIVSGGDGIDRLIADVAADRLIDWNGNSDLFIVPGTGRGAPTILHSPDPLLRRFLRRLAVALGATNPDEEIALP